MPLLNVPVKKEEVARRQTLALNTLITPDTEVSLIRDGNFIMVGIVEHGKRRNISRECSRAFGIPSATIKGQDVLVGNVLGVVEAVVGGIAAVHTITLV